MTETSDRIGRRGASLLTWGLMWFLAGLPLLFYTPHSTLHIIALKTWAAAFVAAGGLAILTSFRRSPRADRLGFVALSLVGSCWVVYCLVMWVASIVLDQDIATNLPLLTTGVTDAILVIKINIDAGWPEPQPPLKPIEAVLDGGKVESDDS